MEARAPLTYVHRETNTGQRRTECVGFALIPLLKADANSTNEYAHAMLRRQAHTRRWQTHKAMARFSIGGDEQGLQYHRVCTAHSPCIPCRCLRSFESPDPAPCMRVRALEIGGSRACVRACTGRGLRTDNLLASWFRFCSNTCSCLPKFQLSRSNPYRIRKGFNTMRPALRSPRQWRPAELVKLA